MMMIMLTALTLRGDFEMMSTFLATILGRVQETPEHDDDNQIYLPTSG